MTSTVVQHEALDPLLLTRFEQMRSQGKPLRIILPEGGDPRVHEAARILRSLGAEPLLVGGPAQIPGAMDIDLLRTEKALAHLQERLAPRGMEALAAARRDPLALAMSALAVGESQAVVAGATRSTAEVMRTAFRVVGPAAGQETVSSSFLMHLASGDYYAFGDCAVIPDPKW